MNPAEILQDFITTYLQKNSDFLIGCADCIGVVAGTALLIWGLQMLTVRILGMLDDNQTGHTEALEGMIERGVEDEDYLEAFEDYDDSEDELEDSEDD